MEKKAVNKLIAELVGRRSDFYSDLNAMHEAENVLNIPQSYAYGDLLAQMVREPENIAAGDKPSKKFPFNGWGFFGIAHLTAAQRAKAFLRVMRPELFRERSQTEGGE